MSWYIATRIKYHADVRRVLHVPHVRHPHVRSDTTQPPVQKYLAKYNPPAPAVETGAQVVVVSVALLASLAFRFDTKDLNALIANVTSQQDTGCWIVVRQIFVTG